MDCTSERGQIQLQNQIKEKCGNRIIKVILEPVKLHLKSSSTPTQSSARLSESGFVSGKNSFTKKKKSSNLKKQESESGKSEVSTISESETGLIGCSNSDATDETNVSRIKTTHHRRTKKLKSYAEIASSSSEESDAEMDSPPIFKRKPKKSNLNSGLKTSPVSVPSTSTSTGRRQNKSRTRNLKPKQAATCEICGKKYSSVSLLERHILENHVMDNPFECDVCYKAFISKIKLTEHFKTHYNESLPDFPYICSKNKCTFECKTKNELKLHFSNTHINIANNEGSSHFCPFCDTLFENDTNFQEHLKVSAKLLKCRTCRESADSERLELDTQCNLNQHVKDKHPKKTKAIVKTKVTQKKDGSLTAGDPDNKNLSRINTPHCDSRPGELSTAEADSVNTFANLNLKLGTETSETSSKSASDFKCLVCGVSFSRRSELNIHEKLEDHQRWKCPACPKLLKNKYALKVHLATIHSDARPVKCEHADCDKAFKNRRELLRHRVVHSGSGSEKMLKHKCDECTKSFMNPASLRQHLAKYHGGEKPYKCPECPKAYATSWELRGHSVSHSDKRGFPCAYCDRRYKSVGEAKTHMRNSCKNNKNRQIKTGTEQVFECHVCQKKFASAHLLKQHLVVHTNQRPFSCKFCDATYKSHGQAGQHQKKCQVSTPAERRKRAKLSKDVMKWMKRKREKIITGNKGSTGNVAGQDPDAVSSSTTATPNFDNTARDTDKNFKAKQEVESNSSDSDHDIFVEKHSMVKVMFEKVPKVEEEK